MKLKTAPPEHALAAEADLEDSEILFNSGMREQSLALLQDVVKRQPGTARAGDARFRLLQLYEMAPSRNQKIPILAALENASVDAAQISKAAGGRAEGAVERAELRLRYARLFCSALAGCVKQRASTTPFSKAWLQATPSSSPRSRR